MMLGFGFATVLWTLWWNLDYSRFMKFWVKPPNKRLTVIIFRVLFALWFLSAVQMTEALRIGGRNANSQLTWCGAGPNIPLKKWVPADDSGKPGSLPDRRKTE
jgi:hypothetical protein